MSIYNRAEIQQSIIEQLSLEEITLGQAILTIRTQLYKLTQADYAKMCHVSEKTLREVEKGNTDPRLSIIERLLHPGGMALTVRAKTHRVLSMQEQVKNKL